MTIYDLLFCNMCVVMYMLFCDACMIEIVINFIIEFVSMVSIETRIKNIEQRNTRVELDKAWETSFSRKILIAVLTYITIVLFFVVAQLPKPFINSIVPTTGFVLSTLSLPFFKKVWIKKKNI